MGVGHGNNWVFRRQRRPTKKSDFSSSYSSATLLYNVILAVFLFHPALRLSRFGHVPLSRAAGGGAGEDLIGPHRPRHPIARPW